MHFAVERFHRILELIDRDVRASHFDDDRLARLGRGGELAVVTGPLVGNGIGQVLGESVGARPRIDLLDLEPIEVNIFRGRSSDENRLRVFGGQVAGQALVAAARTVDDINRHVHSLHAYFLRPGDPAAPRYRRISGTGSVDEITARALAALA